MADPFTQDPSSEEVTKIKVGEKEFTQDELNSLVSFGEKAREIEKNHGSFDKYVSDYGRKSDEIGKLRAENEALKSKPVEPVKVDTEFTEEQRQVAQKQLADIMGGQPVTDKQLDTWFETKYTVRRSAEKLLDELGSLESEIDGSDGRPKFDQQEVLDYMAKNGTKKPMLAYKELHGDELDKWTHRELIRAKPQGWNTEEQAPTAKQPAPVKITRDNLNSLVSEQLYGNNG